MSSATCSQASRGLTARPLAPAQRILYSAQPGICTASLLPPARFSSTCSNTFSIRALRSLADPLVPVTLAVTRPPFALNYSVAIWIPLLFPRSFLPPDIAPSPVVASDRTGQHTSVGQDLCLRPVDGARPTLRPEQKFGKSFE
ncbi:hypothetical protein BKA81DRAFT_161734 [Phyllosticta paracitricarpa]